jgi:hypothetical protein
MIHTSSYAASEVRPDTVVKRPLGSLWASLACPGEPYGKERITFCSASLGSHGVQGDPRSVGIAQPPFLH